MPKVIIQDKDLQPLFEADFSRVPCVGEKLSLADSDGNGNTYTVKWVNWEFMVDNSKPVEAKVSLDLDNSDHWFEDWYKPILKGKGD